MTYRLDVSERKEEYHFLFHKGGTGDTIGQFPAIKYVLDHHPQITLNLWVHDYAFELTSKVFESYSACHVRHFKDLKDAPVTGPTRSPYLCRIGNLSSHITDHAFFNLLGGSVEDKYKDYVRFTPVDVDDFHLPIKYAVVTTGYTAPARIWKPEYIKQVTDYLVSIGITPVYLGKSNNGPAHFISGTFQADYSNGLNLIDKTTLLEAHGIMAKATMTLGVDNGLLHLNSCTHTPGIWGFTSVEPRHRLPYKHGILGHGCYVVKPKNLPCFGCQSNMHFIESTHDFKYCRYDDNQYACVTGLTPDLWIEQIDKVLVDSKKWWTS